MWKNFCGVSYPYKLISAGYLSPPPPPTNFCRISHRSKQTSAGGTIPLWTLQWLPYPSKQISAVVTIPLWTNFREVSDLYAEFLWGQINAMFMSLSASASVSLSCLVFLSVSVSMSLSGSVSVPMSLSEVGKWGGFFMYQRRVLRTFQRGVDFLFVLCTGR
jgi:hypothetical protein